MVYPNLCTPLVAKLQMRPGDLPETELISRWQRSVFLENTAGLEDGLYYISLRYYTLLSYLPNPILPKIYPSEVLAVDENKLYLFLNIGLSYSTM